MGDINDSSADTLLDLTSCTSPLFLPTVLNIIFNELSDDDLCSASHVCTVWRAEACRLIGHRHSYTLTNTEDITELLRFLSFNPNQKATKLYFQECELDHSAYTQLMKKASPTLSTLFMDTCVVDSMEPVHEVIRNAPHLTRLTLDTLKRVLIPGTAFRDTHYFRHALFPIMDPTNPTCALSFPNIRQLEYMAYEKAFDGERTTLASAIKTFPNLEKLAARFLITGDPEVYKTLALPNLKRLTVIMGGRGMRRIDDVDLTTFLNLQLNLVTITFQNVDAPSISPELLRKFLESQTNLRSLTLEQVCEVYETSISVLPMKLPGLKKLCIDRTFIRNVNHVMSSFPQLTALAFAFSGQDQKWAQILPKKVVPHENVRTLQFDWIDSKSFRSVVGAFPNVRRLTLDHANDAILTLVFTALPNITFLQCSESKEQDEKMSAFGVTGREPPVGLKLKTLTRAPYIGVLKGLKNLQMSFTSPPHESILWDGILHCTKLMTLTLIGLKLSGKTLRGVARKSRLTNMRITKSMLRDYRLVSKAELEYPIYCFGNVNALTAKRKRICGQVRDVDSDPGSSSDSDEDELSNMARSTFGVHEEM